MIICTFGAFRSDKRWRKSRMTSAEGFCWVSKTDPSVPPAFPWTLHQHRLPLPGPGTKGILLDILAALYTFSLPTGENGVADSDAGIRWVYPLFHSVISAIEEPAVPKDKCSGLWWADEWIRAICLMKGHTCTLKGREGSDSSTTLILSLCQ